MYRLIIMLHWQIAWSSTANTKQRQNWRTNDDDVSSYIVAKTAHQIQSNPFQFRWRESSIFGLRLATRQSIFATIIFSKLVLTKLDRCNNNKDRWKIVLKLDSKLKPCKGRKQLHKFSEKKVPVLHWKIRLGVANSVEATIANKLQ